MQQVTQKDLAKLAHVTIGTIDRALNNRPGINKETKELILKLAKEHDYKANRLSKALALKKSMRFGIITLPTTSAFTRDLLVAIKNKGEELSDYGVRLLIRSLDKFEALSQADIIKELIAQRVDGIALEGIDDPIVTVAVDKAAKSGIPVVTFNTDLKNSRRRCFVGQNLNVAGQVAADLLGKFVASEGDIFILHGSKQVAAHCERVDGFLRVCGSDFPKINVVAIEESLDDEDVAYHKTMKVLSAIKSVKGIYVAASGSQSVGKALLKLNIANKVSVVCNDIVPGTREFIQQNIIDATILQDPQTQGRLPIDILTQMIFDKKTPEKEYYYTKIEILTKHML